MKINDYKTLPSQEIYKNQIFVLYRFFVFYNVFPPLRLKYFLFQGIKLLFARDWDHAPFPLFFSVYKSTFDDLEGLM